MTTAGPHRVLLVDDEEVVRRSMGQWLSVSDFDVTTAASAAQALAAIQSNDFDAVLSDIRMPDQDGLQLLKALRVLQPALPVVLLTAHGDVAMAVAALKDGAFDFLTKPHDPDRLVSTLKNACEQRRLLRRISSLEAQLDESEQLEARLIGHSASVQKLRDNIRSIAALPLDVILRGETGTGKEVAARALHDYSSRRDKPFVAINCAAIPSEMIESELFGHEAGAFTGARNARVGKFEFARGGTVLLDEIESMPQSAQVKVLRALQERVIERIGSNRQVPIDVRFVSATKSDLRVAADQGTFRSDLYYRLAGFEILIPPLRERGDDILLLFSKFAAAAGREAGRQPPDLSPHDVAFLLTHDWPGNVRELKITAERFGLGLGLAITGDGHKPASVEAQNGASLTDKVDRYERMIIQAALKQAKGSVAQVIETLQIPRRTLNEKMKRFGISRGDLG